MSSLENGPWFSAIRPYPGGIRRRVFGFLESLGYRTRADLLVPARTPDAEAARWVDAHAEELDLLLLPFHVHRDRGDKLVDGIGIILAFRDGRRASLPILMPISEYSYRASFPRRLEELSKARPELRARIVPMPEHTIGSPEVRAAIERIAKRA